MIVGLLMMLSCKPGTPSQYIQPDEMEDILVDYHLARAMADNADVSFEERDYYHSLYEEAVMQKHGVTKAEFDSSLVYYYRRADRFTDIYKRVAERLEEQALVLGATEGEIGKYSSFGTVGDTANIWVERSMQVLLPTPPYNKWSFELEVDSTFRGGDSFLMQFMSDFLYQDGTRDGVLYLAATYDNDTTVSRNYHFSTVGLSQMRLPALDNHAIQRLRGYFYLGGGMTRSTTVRMLFLSNIQLIRFHDKKKEEEIHEEEPKDSLERDSVGGRIEEDSVGGGNLQRGGQELLSPDSGAAIHRVVRRPDMPETR